MLVPLGFAPGQVGAMDGQGQVIFCREDGDSTDDGCLGLVVDVAATPDWRVVDVRWWGFTADRWHLPLDRDGTLADQLAGLARTLPDLFT